MSTTQPASPAPALEGPVSLEQFLAWPDEDLHAEWVEGEITVMSPASKRHQQLTRFLTACTGLFVEAHRLGEVLAPFAMHLPAIPSVREPDLLFVATQHLDRLTDTHLAGPADLVVEIVSPDSLGRDRGDKFAEYEASGIPEYWLVDPLREQAEFYRLVDGRYRPAPLTDGAFHSSVLPGFHLQEAWLWQDPLPAVVTVLRQLQVL